LIIDMLHSAVAKNSASELRKALNEPFINVNERDRKLQTPLHVVAEQGLVMLMELLLAKPQIDVNAKDKELWTPLHCACSSGNLDCVERLLEHPKIDATILNKSGSNALHYLVRHRCDGAQLTRLLACLTRFIDKGTYRDIEVQ
jgi:ankyrin repeat protein